MAVRMARRFPAVQSELRDSDNSQKVAQAFPPASQGGIRPAGCAAGAETRTTRSRDGWATGSVLVWWRRCCGTAVRRGSGAPTLSRLGHYPIAFPTRSPEPGKLRVADVRRLILFRAKELGA